MHVQWLAIKPVALFGEHQRDFPITVLAGGIPCEGLHHTGSIHRRRERRCVVEMFAGFKCIFDLFGQLLIALCIDTTGAESFSQIGQLVAQPRRCCVPPAQPTIPVSLSEAFHFPLLDFSGQIVEVPLCERGQHRQYYLAKRCGEIKLLCCRYERHVVFGQPAQIGQHIKQAATEPIQLVNQNHIEQPGLCIMDHLLERRAQRRPPRPPWLLVDVEHLPAALLCKRGADFLLCG
ncbi:MAG: hypothetical protein AAF787_14440 [Chloroflexota bacterium]